MEKKVLVGLRSHDRIDDAVSFLQDIVTPGMQVVFLIPYPVEPWSYLPRHCDDAEIGRAATLANRKHLSQFVWETQRTLAETRVFGARQALRNKNVEVEFELYTGRLTWAIRDCMARSEFHWILTWGREWFGFAVRKTFANLFESETTRLRAMYVYQRRYAQ
jgi:hypothetical protein